MPIIDVKTYWLRVDQKLKFLGRSCCYSLLSVKTMGGSEEIQKWLWNLMTGVLYTVSSCRSCPTTVKFTTIISHHQHTYKIWRCQHRSYRICMEFSCLSESQICGIGQILTIHCIRILKHYYSVLQYIREINWQFTLYCVHYILYTSLYLPDSLKLDPCRHYIVFCNV